MKISKLLQRIFKEFFQLIFKIFYGKINGVYDLKEKGIILKNIKNLEIENKNIEVNYNIYEILKGRVYTDTNEHVAFIKDNKIIPNISYQQIKGNLKEIKFNKVFKSGTPRMIKNITGRTLSLIQGNSGNNYFHFLFDIVPKLLLLEKKRELNNIDYFYIPGKHKWQKKIMSVFGISDKSLMNSQKYRHIKSTSLLAMDHPWYNKGFTNNEFNHIPNWIIYAIREKFLKYSKKFDISERVFIDRSDSYYSHCKLINNIETIEFLKTKGFNSYKLSELDFFEQIYLFNNSKIIIGPHGAGFANIVFSKKDSKIIEIAPKNHSEEYYRKLSKILNLKYEKIYTENFEANNKVAGDIKLNILNLEKILKSYDIS